MSTTITRSTKETQISLTLSLRGTGRMELATGLPFFDHMLSALCLHGGLDLSGSVQGDLQVDPHHTMEDLGIVLGDALLREAEALGPLARYGSAFVPMDEALCFACLDLSRRPYLAYQADPPQEQVGGIDSQLFEEFFRALAVHGGLTLHLKCETGRNTHHIIEGLFKALGRALREAKAPADQLYSTKGML